jgi:hypothetical protein
VVAIPVGVAVRIWIRIVAAAIIEATAERDWKQEPYASHQPRMSRDAAVVQVSLTTALRFGPAPAAVVLRSPTVWQWRRAVLLHKVARSG